MNKRKIIIGSKEINFHFLNIDKYSSDFIDLIKSEIINIWDGDMSDYDLEHVKRQLKNFFKNKEGTPEKKYAFIAEFICHLYLRQLGYEQYSVLKNLEEIKAPKKGFDGLYENNGLIWLVESKSAMPDRTTPITHNDKIGEAYRDLKDKLENNTEDLNKNNPWENAKSHFLHTEKKNDSILNHIKRLSKSYEKREEMKIDHFNVIPCSTIYLSNRYYEIDCDELQKKLESLLSKYSAKNIAVLCINKNDIDNFMTFLNEK